MGVGLGLTLDQEMSTVQLQRSTVAILRPGLDLPAVLAPPRHRGLRETAGAAGDGDVLADVRRQVDRSL